MKMATILPQNFSLITTARAESLPRSSVLTVRKEVEAYAAVCERLLKLELPLNDFERRIFNFYLAELTHKIPQERIDAKM